MSVPTSKTLNLIVSSRWLYTPRSCAVLYVPKHNQHFLRTTLPTSWGFISGPSSAETPKSVLEDPNAVKEKTPFEELFEFVATSDDSAYICVPAALKFRKEVCGGEEAVMSYCIKLANEAADAVASILGTDVLQEPDLRPGEISNMRQCAMATVRLPVAVADEPVSGALVTVSPKEAPGVFVWIQKTLLSKHNTFVPVFRHGSWLWTRLSVQTFLEKSDFEWLGGILRDLCEQVARKAHK